MKKIKYIKRANEVCAYFDKSLFDSESNEKKYLIYILEQVLETYLFEGIITFNCKNEDLMAYFRKYVLKSEEIEKKKSILINDITLKITFGLNNFKDILDLLYQNDITFDGVAIRMDSFKTRIVLNDHDGSCIILRGNSNEIEYYKKQFFSKLIG